MTPQILIEMENKLMRYTVLTKKEQSYSERQELNTLDELNAYIAKNVGVKCFVVIGTKEDGTSMAKHVLYERGHTFPSQTLKKETIDNIKRLGFNIINKCQNPETLGC